MARVRKKPTTKQIRQEEQVLNNPPHGEFGGYMPNPPEGCTARRPFVGQGGTEYVDMSLCGHCKRKCDRYWEHDRAMKQWWEECHRIVENKKARRQGK